MLHGKVGLLFFWNWAVLRYTRIRSGKPAVPNHTALSFQIWTRTQSPNSQASAPLRLLRSERTTFQREPEILNTSSYIMYTRGKALGFQTISSSLARDIPYWASSFLCQPFPLNASRRMSSQYWTNVSSAYVMDFVNTSWKCAGFLLITSGFLINLRIESTAQFGVCAPATASQDALWEVQNTRLRLFCFPERKRRENKKPSQPQWTWLNC